MTAPHIIDPAGLLGEALSQSYHASRDVEAHSFMLQCGHRR